MPGDEQALRRALVRWQHAPDLASLVCPAAEHAPADLLVDHPVDDGVWLSCPECRFRQFVRAGSELAHLILRSVNTP